MIRVPCVAIIIKNSQGEILLLLRDDDPTISFPNHWTLVGGKVEDGETSETAAHRELLEEIDVDIDLTFWKRYDRQHPNAIVDQHIYLGKILYRTNVIARRFLPKQSPILRAFQLKKGLPRRQRARAAARNDINLRDVR
jgi:8-oxo-dGTP pyrophosphatase MutT (NUDIX family)